MLFHSYICGPSCAIPYCVNHLNASCSCRPAKSRSPLHPHSYGHLHCLLIDRRIQCKRSSLIYSSLSFYKRASFALSFVVINHHVLSLRPFNNCFHALQSHMNLADVPSVIQRLMSGITCLSIYKTIFHTFLQKHIKNLQRTTVADIAI